MSNQISPLARREAIAASQQESLPELPADATISEMKPTYYGLIGRVIEPIIISGVAGSPAINRFAYVINEIPSDDHFQKLYVDIAYHLGDEVEPALDGLEPAALERLEQVHERFVKERRVTSIGLADLIKSGCTTAAKTAVDH